MISQKTSRQVFHSNEHKCVEKKHFVEKLLSFEIMTRIMLEPLYQNPFYMFIKMLDEFLKNCPQNISKKEYIVLSKVTPHNVLSPKTSPSALYFRNWRKYILMVTNMV
jgi:hypothetical protein